MTTRFKFRVMPFTLTPAQKSVPVHKIEVIDCQTVPVPTDAKLWPYKGAPVQLPTNPVPEADWDAWWTNFEGTHLFTLQGARLSKSADWQWVEITA